MKRIKIKIEYNGMLYSGWQVQNEQETIQGKIQDAIFKVFGKRVEICGSGRTDAGVHAYGQIAHFDIDESVPTEKVAYLLNRALPQDINILEAQEVSQDFHARFSAHKKTYLYRIYNQENKLPFLNGQFAWERKKIDEKKMQEAGLLLIGKHNFKAFCSAMAQVTSYEREIFDIKVWREGDYILTEVCGSGFLYNMVRIIVGTLVDYALGLINLDNIKLALETGERNKSGRTMPAGGLYLKNVTY